MERQMCIGLYEYVYLKKNLPHLKQALDRKLAFIVAYYAKLIVAILIVGQTELTSPK